MAGSHSQEPLPTDPVHLVLFDGVCGLCSRLLNFFVDHDRRGLFAFASLQSEVGKGFVQRFGGDPCELTTLRVVTAYRTDRAEMLTRSRAALFVAGELGWPWKAATFCRVLPAALLDIAYEIVARHRYRVFGRYEQCLVPKPELRRRFID